MKLGHVVALLLLCCVALVASSGSASAQGCPGVTTGTSLRPVLTEQPATGTWQSVVHFSFLGSRALPFVVYTDGFSRAQDAQRLMPAVRDARRDAGLRRSTSGMRLQSR